MKCRTGSSLPGLPVWIGLVLVLCSMAAQQITPAHAQLSVPETMSQKWRESSEPWKIEALKISHDRLQGIYEAEGGVRISSADRSIQSDWARLDSNNQQAELRGSVMIRYGQDWLKGEHAVWNLGSETGFLDGGLIYFSKNQFYVRGKTIAKTGQDQFELTDGMITSCDPDNPDWSVRFSRMQVEIDGLAKVKDTSFWVRSIPIFYSPVFALPANSRPAVRVPAAVRGRFHAQWIHGGNPLLLGHTPRHGRDVLCPVYVQARFHGRRRIPHGQ